MQRRLLGGAVLTLWLSGSCLFAANVKVVRQGEGWELKVDGKPYFVRGVSYSADKVGEDPNAGTQRDWMIVDDDHDGRIDVAYQSWVDKNRNNVREPDEPPVGDFKLLADMGANTIRIYHHSSGDPAIQALYPEGGQGALIYNHAPNKKLLRDLFTRYGIRVAMGDEIGAYAVGSGASWDVGTDYHDPQQKENIRKSVEAMVKDFKDEPYLLFWVLGNENNYAFTHTNAGRFPKEYAQFVNTLAQLIHRLDPSHPVVLANGETQHLRTYAQYAPDIDIFGVNSYRHPDFGFLWKEVSGAYPKPVVLTEYGATKPRFKEGALDEVFQVQELRRRWCDIENHGAGKQLPGNALGGFVYAWMDNWWQDGNPEALFSEPDRGTHEALGLVSQGDGRQSPLLRQLRQSYFMYQKLWKTGSDSCRPGRS